MVLLYTSSSKLLQVCHASLNICDGNIITGNDTILCFCYPDLLLLCFSPLGTAVYRHCTESNPDDVRQTLSGWHRRG